MPTVPRLDGRKVLAEPMPGARVSISADEETFGGGASSKAIVAATEQLNTTIQNKIARNNATNQLRAANVAIADDKNAWMQRMYDPTIIKVDVPDGKGGKITKEIPRGFMLRQAKDASINGGAMGPDAIGAIDAIAAERSKSLTDPDAAYRYGQGTDVYKQALYIKAIEWENSQKKEADEQDRKYSLTQTANDRIMPLAEKIAEGKRIQEQFSQGVPQSKIDADLEEHAFESVKSELNEVLDSRVASEKEVEKLIKDASEKYGVNPGHIDQLRGMVATKEAQAIILNGEAKIKAEVAGVTTPLTFKNEWKVGGSIGGFTLEKVPSKTKLNKIQQKGQMGEMEYFREVALADKNSAKLALSKTDNPAFTDLMIKMVAPGYADDKKRLDHIRTYREGKLSPDDYNVIGAMYAMDPQEKHNASMGLKGFEEKARNNPNITPDEKRQVFEMYMKEVPKINDKYTQTDAFDKVNLEFNKLSGAAEPDDTVDTMRNNKAKMNGKNVHIQSTGKSTTPKTNPTATLKPKVDRVTIISPDGEEQSVPKEKLQYYLDKGGKVKNG